MEECRGCVIINDTRCCYNCGKSIITGNGRVCVEYGPMLRAGKKLTEETKCLSFVNYGRKERIGKEVQVNYCPVCGKPKQEG